MICFMNNMKDSTYIKMKTLEVCKGAWHPNAHVFVLVVANMRIFCSLFKDVLLMVEFLLLPILGYLLKNALSLSVL